MLETFFSLGLGPARPKICLSGAGAVHPEILEQVGNDGKPILTGPKNLGPDSCPNIAAHVPAVFRSAKLRVRPEHFPIEGTNMQQICDTN